MIRNEWALWSDFIGLFVATGFVQGELAQSVLLVGPPGEGKSALLGRFHSVPSVMYAMDATAEGLKQQVFRRAIKEKKRHLILPEMFKLMQRRGPTADNTIGVLTLAMSGEMLDSYIGDKQMDEYPKGFQLGVIGAMPTRVFADWKQTINNTGLLSRMVPVPFGFSDDMRQRILRAIAAEDKRLLQPVRHVWPSSPVAIKYDGGRIGPHVLRLSDEIEEGGGQRLTKLIVSLVKAAALLERDDVVQLKHVEMVRQFAGILRNRHPR